MFRASNTVVAVLVGLAQCAFALRLAFVLRRRRRAAPPARWPAVSVIVPCKFLESQSGELDGNIRSLLAQDYPGPHEYLFVCPREADPARARLLELLEGNSSCRLLVSDASPSRCSEKNLNLLYAVERARPETGIFAFADCDMRVPPDWLRGLVVALADRAAGASTAPAAYVAHERKPLAFLRMAWMCLPTAAMAAAPLVCGYSWAIRREDFAGLNVAELWRRSLIEDFVLNPLLRSKGRAVAWSAGGLPACLEQVTGACFLGTFTKGLRYCRVYSFPIWVVSGLWAFGKLYLWMFFFRARMPAVFALMAALDMAAAAGAMSAFMRLAPETFAGLHPFWRRWAVPLAALAVPAWPPLLAAAFAASAFSSTVRWGGYTYQVKGPFDVRVSGGTA